MTEKRARRFLFVIAASLVALLLGRSACSTSRYRSLEDYFSHHTQELAEARAQASQQAQNTPLVSSIDVDVKGNELRYIVVYGVEADPLSAEFARWVMSLADDGNTAKDAAQFLVSLEEETGLSGLTLGWYYYDSAGKLITQQVYDSQGDTYS